MCAVGSLWEGLLQGGGYGGYDEWGGGYGGYEEDYGGGDAYMGGGYGGGYEEYGGGYDGGYDGYGAAAGAAGGMAMVPMMLPNGQVNNPNHLFSFATCYVHSCSAPVPVQISGHCCMYRIPEEFFSVLHVKYIHLGPKESVPSAFSRAIKRDGLYCK